MYSDSDKELWDIQGCGKDNKQFREGAKLQLHVWESVVAKRRPVDVQLNITDCSRVVVKYPDGQCNLNRWLGRQAFTDGWYIRLGLKRRPRRGYPIVGAVYRVLSP